MRRREEMKEEINDGDFLDVQEGKMNAHPKRTEQK